MRRALTGRIAVYALAAWTVFTWGTRVRNAAADHEAVTAYLVPTVLIVVSAAAAVRPRRWGRLLALAASLAWLVRVPVIVAGDRSVGFKVVHTALAVITWALAAWVLRAAPEQSRARRRATA